MEPIRSTIESVIRNLSERKTASHSVEIGILLKKLLTKGQLKHIKFNYFRKGILGLSVDSSGWLYQLSLEKEKLLARLRLEPSSPGIKDIRFSIGE